jgi:hypothetical protein
MNQQLVTPNTAVTDGTGWCLRFTQKVWGAPARYKSAWDAWNATTLKHAPTENIPTDVSVVVWFEHWGTYGENGNSYYGNWGHVVSWIAGRGYLSSPTRGTGQQWFGTIQEVERAFNAKYVGWSEDINGLRVVNVDSNNGENDMATLYWTDGPIYALAGDGVGEAAWLEFTDQKLAGQIAGAKHVNQTAVYLTPASFRAWQAKYLSKAPVSGGSTQGPTTVTIPDFNITMTGQAVKINGKS